MIKITKDGRTIRTGRHYTDFRVSVWEHQFGVCYRCPRRTDLGIDIFCDNSFHVHHVNGRGIGGSKRDDVIERDGHVVCEGLCGICHRKEHNQQ